MNNFFATTKLTAFDHTYFLEMIQLFEDKKKQSDLKLNLLNKYLLKIKSDEIDCFETCRYVYKKHPFKNQILVLDRRCFSLNENKIYGRPVQMEIKPPCIK